MSDLMPERSRSPVPWLASAALLMAASIAARWPGVAMYDSVSQYDQALEHAYTDWHPPIMAETWALLNRLWPGTEPFFLIQMLLWWGGLGLLSAALGRRGRHGAAACVLLVGVAPLFLGWVTVVLKDAQMACCLAAAVGIDAWWRLDECPRPRWAVALILLLIGYATLVRGNAVFATAPLLLVLWGWAGVRTWWGCGAMLAALTLALLAAGPLINHRLLGAEQSHVERSLTIYDVAGIGHHAHLPTVPGLSPVEWERAERAGCYTPFFWNPYGEPAECDFVGQRLGIGDPTRRQLTRDWLMLIVRHPVAYVVHRAGHLNANLRFWVGPGEPSAPPPLDSEPNTFGLGKRSGAAGRALITAGRVMAESPLGWPVLWLAVAVGLLCASDRSNSTGQVALGRALALSAACMSASFAVVSIASDLRYHLWSMVAAALALILLVDARAFVPRRAAIAAAGVLALLVLASAAHLGAASPVYVPLPARIPPPPAARA